MKQRWRGRDRSQPQVVNANEDLFAFVPASGPLWSFPPQEPTWAYDQTPQGSLPELVRVYRVRWGGGEFNFPPQSWPLFEQWGIYLSNGPSRSFAEFYASDLLARIDQSREPAGGLIPAGDYDLQVYVFGALPGRVVIPRPELPLGTLYYHEVQPAALTVTNWAATLPDTDPVPLIWERNEDG